MPLTLPIAPRTHASHSQLSTAALCHRKWYYGYLRNLGKPGTSSPPAVAGKVLHAGLPTLYTSGWNVDLAVAALRTAWEDELDSDNSSPFQGRYEYLTRGHCEVVLKNYADEYAEREPFKVAHLTEGKLYANVPGISVPLEGIIDMVVEENGKYLVFDHKSTTGWLGSNLYEKVLHEKQLRLYALLLKHSIGIEVVGGICNAIYTGEYASRESSKATKFDRYRYMFTQAELEETVEWANNNVETLDWLLSRFDTLEPEEVDETAFVQNGGRHCGWCDFSDLCASPPQLREGRIQMNYTQKTVDNGENDEDSSD